MVDISISLTAYAEQDVVLLEEEQPIKTIDNIIRYKYFISINITRYLKEPHK